LRNKFVFTIPATTAVKHGMHGTRFYEKLCHATPLQLCAPVLNDHFAAPC